MLLTDCQDEREWLTGLPLGFCHMSDGKNSELPRTEGQEQEEIKSLPILGTGVQSGQGQLDFPDGSPAVGGSPSEFLRVPFHPDVGSSLTLQVTDTSRGSTF